MVLTAARDAIDKGLLDGCVKVPIARHEMLPSPLEDGGVDFPNTGGESNRSEVGGA